MKKNTFTYLMLFGPWLTVPFLGIKSFIRFLPVACFVNLSISILSVVANKKRWWINNNPIFLNGPVDFSYIMGPYFVGTLWIFKCTYGNFKKYLLVNILINIINAYPLSKSWDKMGVFKFIRMRKSIYYLCTILLSIIIYKFQKLLENTVINTYK